ncbi:TraR/DksA C4-type zinc finger protein [bacterium]|nr:TraR/DksA C4-type zinc finger protein [bacterium]
MELDVLSNNKGMQRAGDAADAAFDASGEEISSQLAELEAKELVQVERAIRRLKQGTYGKCEGCQTKIPMARLSALPYSTLCIKCQREFEREGSVGDYTGEADYGRIGDSRNPMDEREFRISDLEIHLSR